MSTLTHDQSLDGRCQSYTQTNELYNPSIASSASSSQISVFSDTTSAQSSIASSISDDFRISQEDARERSCAGAHISQLAKYGSSFPTSRELQHPSTVSTRQDGSTTYAEVTSVPLEQRQHPRRCSSAKYQKPPPLVRQCERKISFVDNLVDSATQMVEVIWPLSVVPCSSGGRGVLPLRTYIEETLRRSRTSYSTLQVALYYLILIKPFVPKCDFNMAQDVDCPASRALMCGRRMFLAALILASKYLQDRNYSAKAWSKMSGLKVNEINTNERNFLAKVNWKLHIPECTFKRWTEVVLRYTPNLPPRSPPACSLGRSTATWKSIVPLLTPELDRVPMPATSTTVPAQCPANYGFMAPATPAPPRTPLKSLQLESTSHESTPTPTTAPPMFLEPKTELVPPTPALARMGPLPTPMMTPSSVASSTPAASICSSRRPSMCSAMAMVQRSGFNRCTMDAYPGLPANYFPSRRPSLVSATSSGSSPETMISDRSRSSRASSISSISTVSTTSSLAPNRACLARQATCRSAGLPLPPALVREDMEGTVTKPIVIGDDVEMVSSPEAADFSLSEKVLHTPHRHSKYALQSTSTPSSEKSRKRHRPRGGRRSDLCEEVRILLEEELGALDAMMDVDDDNDSGSPTPAADYASQMPSRDVSFKTKQAQPPASLLRRESSRVPVEKFEGKKRTCCVSSRMSASPAA